MKKLLLITIIFIIANNLLAQTEFWGITYSGGTDGGGVIFKTDTIGNNQNVEYTFPIDNQGGNPNADLCIATNGKLYGMTLVSGTFEKGVIFEYNPANNSYTKKIDFDGINKGARPRGSLIQATNGKLYGMTEFGGTYNKGVLFEYDPANNSFTKKIDFDGISNGEKPCASLMQATNGKLYGTTPSGGANNMGTLFEYDIVNNQLIKKVDFIDTIGGHMPFSSLMQASNGKLYGMSAFGGISNKGVLFEYSINNNTMVKKVFFNGANGYNPHGSLIQATNGKLYGMTVNGGANNKGVIFEYNIVSDTLINKVDFDGTNGRRPYGSLTQASNGNLYGLTRSGGPNDKGVLFEYDINNDTCFKRVDFDKKNKGYMPNGSLIQTTNGKMYAMTYRGGISNMGVLFEYIPSSNIYTKKLDFMFAINGAKSSNSLIQASNGKLYGMTNIGGVYGNGVLYEYNTANHNFTKKVDFNDTISGAKAWGSLIQADNGKLYGMTEYGGVNNNGVLFEYDITLDTLIKKVDFSNNINGSSPYGALIQATNGKLYGMTHDGGANNFGVLFEYDIANDTLVKKLDFDGVNTGKNPAGPLMQASNGNLYGMTEGGGANNYGVLFEYNINLDTLIKKVDFDMANNGAYPKGSLIQALNGKLYGMSYYDGANYSGTLFEYDITLDTLIVKVNFDEEKGSRPSGSLIQAPNGKLYGMTEDGGVNDYGVLFEYNIAADTLIKKLDFNGINGAYPFDNLVIIERTTSIKPVINDLSMRLFPNPNKGNFTLEINSVNNKPQSYTLEVYNIMGALIHSEKLEITTSLSKQMRFENLSDGVYFISLRSENSILNTRFIVR